MCVSVNKSFLIFCNPMDYSPPGSSVHGILQERLLEWVAISFSRGSWIWPRDWTQVSHIVCGFFTMWATKEVLDLLVVCLHPVGAKNIGCFIFLEYKLQINDNPSTRSCTHMTGFKSQLCHFLIVWSWSSYPLCVCDNGDTECIVHGLLGGTKHPEQWLACSVCCVWHLS